ncbi:MAG: Si-specific NAD(P)(+) transhydrogenase [Phycisphaeraceae bacterium]
MGNFDYDLVCIGSGPAGQRAATQAAKLGKCVAIIEKQRCVGGVCLETGTIPSKTFREAVRSFSTKLDFDMGLGLAPRARPEISHLLGRVNAVMTRESQVQQYQLERNDIDLLQGRASFVDPHTIAVTTDGSVRNVTTANILVACGTKPTDPRGAKADGRTLITSDQVLHLDRLPRTMAVVGAGVIGIEYASMFAALGVKVTMIDKRPKPLEFLDHEIIDELIHQMRNRDVSFRLGEAVESIEIIEGHPTPHGSIKLESGKRVVADLVLFSVGRVGATDTMNLDAAGLESDDRGRLEVDDQLRTNVPHIFAAGDVIGYPSLAATSSEQGRLAACHMFGIHTKAMSEHFPVGIYAIPEISMVGATEEQLTEQRVPYETGIARYREIARGQILGDDTGVVKMMFHRETRRLLGVHAIGTGATELIHVGQAVYALGGDLDYFLNTVFNYPTLAECYKVAALEAANKLNLGQPNQVVATA